IERDLLARSLDILRRQIRADPKVEDRRRNALRPRLPAPLFDGFLKNLAIGLKAHCCDEPGLARAEQIAGAADLEIAHGELKSRPEVREFAYRLEARFSFDGELAMRLMQEVGVRLVRAAPDA